MMETISETSAQTLEELLIEQNNLIEYQQERIDTLVELNTYVAGCTLFVVICLLLAYSYKFLRIFF